MLATSSQIVTIFLKSLLKTLGLYCHKYYMLLPTVYEWKTHIPMQSLMVLPLLCLERTLRHLQCLVKKSKNQQNINTSKIWVLKSMINVIGGSSKARREKLNTKLIKEFLFATLHRWLDHLKKTILSYGDKCHNIWQDSILEEKIISNPS